MVYQNLTAEELEMKDHANKFVSYLVSNFGTNYKSAVGVAGLEKDDLDIVAESNPLQYFGYGNKPSQIRRQMGGVFKVHVQLERNIYPKLSERFPSLTEKTFYENMGTLDEEMEISLYKIVFDDLMSMYLAEEYGYMMPELRRLCDKSD